MPAKRTINFNPARVKQRGAILIIMLVIMIIGITVVLVNSLTSSRVKNARQQNNAAVLAQAKDALIGYAITYGDTHSGQMYGYLPCPDYGGGNPEGSAEPSCGAHDVSVIGRLPWKTLGLPVLRDGDGECLWYAISGTYKDNIKTTGLMNWDTGGQFQVYAADGTLMSNEVVAVVIAPGATQPGQNRSGTVAPVCGGNYTASNYLDSDTINSTTYDNAALTNPPAANAFSQFLNTGAGSKVNDQILTITRQDIWNAFQKRTDIQSTNPNINPLVQLTQQVARCLSLFGQWNAGWGIYAGHGYGNGFGTNSVKTLPWPAPLSLGTNQLSDYAADANYNDSANLYAGRVPYDVGNSKIAPNNKLPGSILMTSAGSCATANWPNIPWPSSLDLWWENWKDQLFYGLSKSFTYTSNNQSCSSTTCDAIKFVNPFPPPAFSYSYNAAVVMLAGPRLSTQTRADKSMVANYLETISAANFTIADGSDTYDHTTTTPSSTFNDVLYCIAPSDLDVTPCP